MKEQCEYNPTAGRARYDGEADCPNESTMCVGSRGKWHLCDSCADLPVFNRLKSRKPLRRLEKKGD